MIIPRDSIRLPWNFYYNPIKSPGKIPLFNQLTNIPFSWAPEAMSSHTRRITSPLGEADVSCFSPPCFSCGLVMMLNKYGCLIDLSHSQFLIDEAPFPKTLLESNVENSAFLLDVSNRENQRLTGGSSSHDSRRLYPLGNSSLYNPQQWSGWWFGTCFFHMLGRIIPLTKSMIFQRGGEKPPSSDRFSIDYPHHSPEE